MKIVSLKRTAAEKKAENSAGGISEIDDSRDGADLHLEGDHLKKMGIDSTLPHGHPMSLQAEGTVHRSSNGPEGGRMTIRLHKVGTEYDAPQAEQEGLRGEIEKNTQDADQKAVTKAAAKGVKVAEKADATGNE